VLEQELKLGKFSLKKHCQMIVEAFVGALLNGSSKRIAGRCAKALLTSTSFTCLLIGVLKALLEVVLESLS